MIEAAARTNAPSIEARARVALSELRYSTKPGGVAAHRSEAEHAIRAFERTGDELGLARAWNLLGSLHHGQGQSTAAKEARERSIEHARRAGSRPDELSGLSWLASVALWGPTHRIEAREHREEILEQGGGRPNG